MIEAAVEGRLQRLASYGFVVVKLVTLGTNGAMDRLILRPRYAPGAPVLVEVKRPGERLRALQGARANDWRARGLDVRDMCDTIDKVDALVQSLVEEVRPQYEARLEAERVKLWS